MIQSAVRSNIRASLRGDYPAAQVALPFTSGLILDLQAGVGMYDSDVAGSLITADGIAIGRWEDQSGNGNHFVQPSAASRMKYDAVKKQVVSEFQTSQNMACAAIPVTSRSTFVAIVELNALKTGIAPLFVGAGLALKINVNTASSVVFFANGAYVGQTANNVMPTNRALIIYSNVSGPAKCVVNGSTITLGTYAAASASGATLAYDGTSRAEAIYKRVLYFNRGLTDPELVQMKAWASANYSVPLAPTVGFHIAGDSISSGQAASLRRSWKEQISYPRGAVVHNTSVPFRKLTTITSTIASADAMNKISGVPNIAILFAGTNDISSDGVTGAVAYARTLDACNTLRSAGFDKIIVCAPLARGNAGSAFQIARGDLRTLMLADFNNPIAGITRGPAGGVTYADCYVDIEADSVIGVAGTQINLTYFADGTHPTSAGHSILATRIQEAVNYIASIYSLSFP